MHAISEALQIAAGMVLAMFLGIMGWIVAIGLFELAGWVLDAVF